MRKLIAVATICCISLLPQATGSAAEHGFTCTIEGSATFEPGLNSEAQELKFVFKGEMSGCQATDGATGGTVKAKGLVNDATCASSAAEGVAKVKWDNGKKSTLDFTTTDVAAVIFLTGTVGKSNSEAAQTGDDVFAGLLFNADITKCNTDEGITEATFEGQVGGGSPS